MLLDYFKMGGLMMWPLLICSVSLMAVLFERFWTIVVVSKFFRIVISHKALIWHHKVMPFFTEIPPSIGLLGTVIGVVHSFSLTNGRMTAETAAAGLGVACFTTIVGLSIAIVASVSEYLLSWMSKVTENHQKENNQSCSKVL